MTGIALRKNHSSGWSRDAAGDVWAGQPLGVSCYDAPTSSIDLRNKTADGSIYITIAPNRNFIKMLDWETFRSHLNRGAFKGGGRSGRPAPDEDF